MGAALVLCSFPWVPALLTSVLGYGQVKRFPRSGLPWALTAAIVVVEVAAVAGGRMAVPDRAGSRRWPRWATRRTCLRAIRSPTRSPR
jgi:hypothetical protein